MPARNLYIALVVVFVSLFIAFKTSVKEQVLRGAVLQLENSSLYEVERDRLFEGALSGLANAVGDSPYTQYMPPERETDYMREIQGQFAGVGFSRLVKDEKTGEFYFVPLRGTPAAEAGLKLGDRVVEVDGKSVKALSVFDLTDAIRGDEGTTVKLKIRPRTTIADFADAGKTGFNENNASSSDGESAENNESVNDSETAQNAENNAASDVVADDAENNESDDDFREVELTRAIVQQDVVAGDRLDENGDWIYTLKDYPEIGYIAVIQFADATTPQTLAALSTLEKEGVSSVILDFRGNPGGFLPDAVAICDEFVAAGAPIVEVRNRNGDVEQLYRATDRPKKSFRVVVLVDGDSASASEIVAAALQDSGIAAVGGERSYGKGTIQSLFKLPCELGLLRATTAEFYRPSGKPIRRRRDATDDEPWGVSPDAALAVKSTTPQHFYACWIRAVRVSGPEADVLDERAFAFVAAQTNAVLRRATQKENAFDRLEALAELGVDPQDAAEALLTPSTVDAAKTSTENSAENQPETPTEASDAETSQTPNAPQTLPLPFKPAGRAPYFDPQLDRAVDYLLGTLETDAPSAPETESAAETAPQSAAE